MKRDPRSLLWDAREAADIIDAITREAAVERQFEIVGEALSQLVRVAPAMAAQIPELRSIIAFRNILIHGYAIIDRARVWRFVQDDLPKLRATLHELLADR